METASAAVARSIPREEPGLSQARVWIGPGKHGGDGLGVARWLAGRSTGCLGRRDARWGPCDRRWTCPASGMSPENAPVDLACRWGAATASWSGNGFWRGALGARSRCWIPRSLARPARAGWWRTGKRLDL